MFCFALQEPDASVVDGVSVARKLSCSQVKKTTLSTVPTLALFTLLQSARFDSPLAFRAL